MSLPDHIEPGLRLVFCGAAWGKQTLRTHKYYKEATNRFWDVLFEFGLTPRRLTPDEDYKLLRFGIGLLDLGRQHYTLSSGRQITSPSADVKAFQQKILMHKPRALAFNGKEAARQVYGVEHIEYGRQAQMIGTTTVFVLPSTSGLASRWWDARCWQELSDFLKTMPFKPTFYSMPLAKSVVGL